MRGTSVWEQKPEWVSGLDRGDQRLKPRGRDWAATSAQAQYGTGSNPSTHSTSDYTRSTGTYVPPYVVTNPNSTRRDNFSTSGNYNPDTGTTATRTPLRRRGCR
jgi:hypothetical protein